MSSSLAERQRYALTDEEGWLRQYGDEALAVAAGEFPRNANGYANVAGLLVKAGAGTLYGFSGYSSRTSTQYIQTFDLATFQALATGAIPETVMLVTASSNFSYDAGRNGRRYLRGIVIANSSTQQTYTSAASDTWFDVQYV